MSRTLADLQAAAVPFAVSLRTSFRGMRQRVGLLLPGPAGWGEFAPFDDYPPPLAGRWLASALEAADIGWPTPVRGSVAVNAIVPAVDPSSPVLQQAATAAPGPGRTIKVKVTGDPAADQARVAAVRALAGPSARIRLDVNAGWSLAEALQQLPLLADVADGLEYVEQPLASLADIVRLREATGIPVAVDETLRRAADPFDPDLLAAVRASADVAVLKVAPLGGVRAVQRLARALDMPVVVSGAMESSIGLSAGIAAACALPEEPLACGLGTGALLATDVIAAPIVASAGRLSPMSLTPDPGALTTAARAVTGAEEQHLRGRLSQAWEHR